MKALVTGGGGFLGTRIARYLHDRGDQVVVLGRRVYPHHQRLGIRMVQADVLDAPAIAHACKGMDVVFHVAAIAGIWGRWQTYWDANVLGTQNVIDGCLRCGVPRLVHTSSPSVVFGKDAVCGVDESAPYATRYLAPYPATKAEAERRVLAANSPNLATVALRPHLIWGPGDPHLIPRVLARARVGKLIQVGNGRNLVDVTYIDNAAEAHLLAADLLAPDATCAGRAYFLSQGEPVEIWTWFNEILAAVGVPQVTRTMPYWLAYRLGALMEATYWLAGVKREPLMTRFLALQLGKSHYFNISAIRRDIGYQPRVSTAEGVRRLVDSLVGGGVDPSGTSFEAVRGGSEVNG